MRHVFEITESSVLENFVTSDKVLMNDLPEGRHLDKLHLVPIIKDKLMNSIDIV